VIATAKVLRVRARSPGAIADAAVAVVAYVQGGQPESGAGLAGYYGRGHARGRARGLAADLVGLRGDVPGEALARLLRTPRTSSTVRLARVEAALDRQITHAVSRAAAEPAEYLTGLLGPQPDTEPAATAWLQSAHRVEDYRHRHLGLPYGTSADMEAIDPTRRARGVRPDGPAAASYDSACQFDGPFIATLPL
jgi:hypothetical protein